MSTFTERLTEALTMTAIAETSSREAAKLDKEIKQRMANNSMIERDSKIASAAMGTEYTPFVDHELERMQTRLDALWDRARQARRVLATLEHAQTEQAVIKVISTNPKGAQIVIHYLRDDGKEVSFTRHVHITGGSAAGLSTISRQQVTYRLPGSALVEAA